MIGACFLLFMDSVFSPPQPLGQPAEQLRVEDAGRGQVNIMVVAGAIRRILGMMSEEDRDVKKQEFLALSQIWR